MSEALLITSADDGSWAWNWWEIVSYWRSGRPARAPFSNPRRHVLPFVLPIVMTPPILAFDRVVCAPVRWPAEDQL